MICNGTIVLHNILAGFSISSMGIAGITLLAVGMVFVIILTIANAKLKVQQDPTVEAIINILPGVNCGGCGLAGCGAYAEAVVKDHGLMGKCGPGGEATVGEIAVILGIEAEASAPVRAIVHCSSTNDDKINTVKYQGVKSCAEAQMVAGVIGCPYGCLGFGDCAEVCEFAAIDMGQGLATIKYDNCVGCGACVQTCPRQLIELLPMLEDPMMVIGCSSKDKAKDVRSYCKVGCVGCGLCAKLAPDMFRMEQKLAVIDYEKYGDPEERDKAQQKCPRSLMIYVGKKSES